MPGPYIFGGDTGQTPESIRRQREIARALAGGIGTPRNVGEGLSAVGRALAYRMIQNRADRQLQAGQAGFQEALSPVVEALRGGGTVPMDALVGVMGNEFATPGAQAVVSALMQNQFKQQDPAYQLDLEMNRKKLDLLNNPPPPDPTAAIQNYEYGQANPDFVQQQLEMERAGAMNNTVTVGENTYQFPKEPEGFVYARDANGEFIMEQFGDTGALRPMLIPISGSEADIEAQSAERRMVESGAEDVRKGGQLTTTIDDTLRLMDEAEKESWFPPTGTASGPAAFFSWTKQGQIASNLKLITSRVALGAIQTLKQLSSTGATGFGAMNKAELDLLINAEGALDQARTDPRIFRRTLKDIRSAWNNTMRRVRMIPRVTLEKHGLAGLLDEPLPGEDTGPPPPSAAETNAKVEQFLQGKTPEERQRVLDRLSPEARKFWGIK